LLESKLSHLDWVLRQSRTLEHRSVPEFLGVPSDEPGFIYPTSAYSAAELLDRHPVVVIVDFSSDAGVFYYGEEAKRRGITIITAVSRYPDESLSYLKSIAEHTRVLCSPNITLGVNFLIIAAKILRNIAPTVDVEVVEQHFKGKQEVSGTARKIARTLEIPEEEIKVIRAGGIIGVHEVLFGFPNQTVRLKHESISREAFEQASCSLSNTFREGRTASTPWRTFSSPISGWTLPRPSLRVRTGSRGGESGGAGRSAPGRTDDRPLALRRSGSPKGSASMCRSSRAVACS
jgi:4-hydroxy-tetrahydrodipicolinate reductase